MTRDTMEICAQVERIAAPSQTEFRENYLLPGKPVILTGAMDRWRARHSWTVDYFNDTVGDVELSVVVGQDKDERGRFDWLKNERTTVRDFLAAFEDDSVPGRYLQAQIPSVFPSLMGDIEIPPFVPGDLRMEPRLFIGAGGSKTPLHNDWPENLHALVSGHKKFFLVDPRQSSLLYANPVLSVNPNHSNVNVDAPDYRRYPRLRGVRAVEAEVTAGDMLFIPSFWWHRVHTLERSIGLAFWWGGKKYNRMWLRNIVPAMAKRSLRGAAGKVGLRRGRHART